MKSTKLNHLILLCCGTALLTFGIVSLSFTLFTIDAVVVYNIKLSTSNETVGITVDNRTLDFGVVPIPGTSRREFALSNNYDRNETVLLSVRGPAARFVSSLNSSIELGPHETKSLPITAYVQQHELSNRTYTGKLTILYKRPIASLLARKDGS